MERTENLNFNQTDRVAAIGKALSSEIRIQILEALEEQEHNVNELAELLELPASSDGNSAMSGVHGGGRIDA